DILAEHTQCVGSVGEDGRVVLPSRERSASKIDTLAAGWPRVFGPAVSDDRHLAHRRPDKRRPVMPIDRDRLLEQTQSLENPVFRSRGKGGKRAQVEIVGGKIIGRAIGRTY